MTEFLIETQCLAPVPTYQNLRHKDKAIIEVHENYQKRGFRNRFVVAGPNGIEGFTVPLVKGKNQKMKISSVQIAYDEDWMRDLFRMLQTNYGSAPFYQHYIDSLLSIFDRREQYLLDLNMNILKWTLKVLRLNTDLQRSDEYQNIPSIEVLDIRNDITPKSLKEKASNVIYNQVYEERHGFIPNLSILDMIMCCGPESASLL